MKTKYTTNHQKNFLIRFKNRILNCPKHKIVTLKNRINPKIKMIHAKRTSKAEKEHFQLLRKYFSLELPLQFWLQLLWGLLSHLLKKQLEQLTRIFNL